MTTSARAARYASLSQHLIDESQFQLDSGDLIQASEKAWGAAAHAIKSVAQTRGWNHHRHDLLRDIVNHLAAEWERPDLIDLFSLAGDLHVNFYEHELDADEVQHRIDRVKTLVAELSAIRDAPPRPFTARTPEQRRRILRLMGSPGPPPDDIARLPRLPAGRA